MEGDADLTDPIDSMIDTLAQEWGLSEGDMELIGGSVVSQSRVIDVVDRLLPLQVTPESTNSNDPTAASVDSTDPSQYANHAALIQQWGHGAHQFTAVHDDLFQSRKRRLDQYGALLHNIYSVMTDARVHGSLVKFDDDTKRRMTWFVETLYYAENLQIARRHLMMLLSSGVNGVRNIPGAEMPTEVFRKRFKSSDSDAKQSPLQVLFVSMLDRLAHLGYRRHCSNVMQPVYIGGRYTYAWEKACTITEFVWQHVNKDMYRENWEVAFHGKGYVEATVQYLEKCCQPEFPDLRVNRRIHSFRNAVYVTSVPDQRGAYQKASYIWYYDEEESPLLKEMTANGDVSVAFHDCLFPGRDELSDARAPDLERVMDHQEWSEDVKEWNRAMIGRMLHPISAVPSAEALECWQIILNYTGMAGAGKSTLLEHVVYHFFPGMVCVIGNNNEKGFGWAKAKGKLLWLAPEVKQDFSDHCDQAQWQQIVEGGRVSAAQKYGDPILFDPWNAPGAMAGNCRVLWQDNSDSVSRRVLDFYFGKQVRKSDPKLPARLLEGLGTIMYVCNEAYLQKCRVVTSRIWNSLPRYFIDLRKENAAHTNPLTHFLMHGPLDFHPEYTMPMDEFKAMFRTHCKEFDLPKVDLTKKESYAGPFQNEDIKVVKREGQRNKMDLHGLRAYNSGG